MSLISAQSFSVATDIYPSFKTRLDLELKLLEPAFVNVSVQLELELSKTMKFSKVLNIRYNLHNAKFAQT
ncbi:MAG: hypothetical protein COY39_03645 [Alphaproteobacteria bacterium CG_4_10_14_0_8_um_filter_37_21]|nr:MAG: hypothetical protein COY39_03645 [Alphaproteobacteria bacterium CG_4_10_14_0_8_um_filter_37_21]